MVTIPLFLMSNIIIALGSSMTGCSQIGNQDVILDQAEIQLSQQGSVVFSADEGSSYKIRFDYYQMGERSYTMILHPFLMCPISVSMDEQEMISVNINGIEYNHDESLAMLDEYAPSFPWTHLPYIIAQGSAISPIDWSLDSWTPNYFKMHYAQNSLEWIVDSSKTASH
jgi:hypothetical protein